MILELYQKVIKIHLSESQCLTLELLIMLMQSYRDVSLSKLAEIFPQPIKYESRVRNLQRFLNLPQLSAKILWFPIIKQLVKKEFREKSSKSCQRKKNKKLKLIHKGYLLLVIDRTQWKERNLIVLSLVWGHHAIPVYWQLIGKKGSSNFSLQKKIIAPVLRLLRPYPILVLGDREFHSVKLAKWLRNWGVDFALRQKKGTCISDDGETYQALKKLDVRPGQSAFFSEIHCTKEHQLGDFNLAVYWKRSYRKKGPKDPWYILTSLSNPRLTLSFYKARWGIETMFKDCKTGGYNIQNTRVNERRFLATILLVTMAYSLATLQGEYFENIGASEYICRPTESKRSVPRHSNFWLGLYGTIWVESMKIWSEEAMALMKLKPHKRFYFNRGLHALSLIQSCL